MFHFRHVPEISKFHSPQQENSMFECFSFSSEMSTAKEKMAVWRTWKEIGVFSLKFHSETDIPTSFRILSVLNFLEKMFPKAKTKNSYSFTLKSLLLQLRISVAWFSLNIVLPLN